jgi:hypothetical protein
MLKHPHPDPPPQAVTKIDTASTVLKHPHPDPPPQAGEGVHRRLPTDQLQLAPHCPDREHGNDDRDELQQHP